MLQTIGIISAIILSLWKIPLIARIRKRKSSKDISLYWVIGVWICQALMVPSGLISEDPVWKVFNMVNFSLFSLVLIVVLTYRRRV